MQVEAEDCLGWLRESNRWRLVAEQGQPLGPEHDAREALARLGLLEDNFDDAYVQQYSSPVDSDQALLTEEEESVEPILCL